MRRGITVLEWVVILAIVLVICAIYLPVSHGEPSGHYLQRRCLGNLKQLALGVVLYNTDFDDRLPRAARWMDIVEPYVKNPMIFDCPGLTTPQLGGHGYAFWRPLSLKQLSGFQKPENTPEIFDSTDLSWNANGALRLLPPKGRHPDGLNCMAFLDSHARCKAQSELYSFITSVDSPK